MIKRKQFSKPDQTIWDHVRASIKPLNVQAPKMSELEDLLNDVKPLRAVNHVYDMGVKAEIILSAITPIEGIDGMLKSKKRALTRGQLEPSARLDLHGDRLEAAKSKFEKFVTQAVVQKHKMILVVTGKGGQMRHGDFGVEVSGVIRRALPDWVNGAEMSKLIAHFCPSHKKHGGEGAYYIFIRASARR